MKFSVTLLLVGAASSSFALPQQTAPKGDMYDVAGFKKGFGGYGYGYPGFGGFGKKGFGGYGLGKKGFGGDGFGFKDTEPSDMDAAAIDDSEEDTADVAGFKKGFGGFGGYGLGKKGFGGGWGGYGLGKKGFGGFGGKKGFGGGYGFGFKDTEPSELDVAGIDDADNTADVAGFKKGFYGLGKKGFGGGWGGYGLGKKGFGGFGGKKGFGGGYGFGFKNVEAAAEPGQDDNSNSNGEQHDNVNGNQHNMGETGRSHSNQEGVPPTNPPASPQERSDETEVRQPLNAPPVAGRV